VIFSPEVAERLVRCQALWRHLGKCTPDSRIITCYPVRALSGVYVPGSARRWRHRATKWTSLCALHPLHCSRGLKTGGRSRTSFILFRWLDVFVSVQNLTTVALAVLEIWLGPLKLNRLLKHDHATFRDDLSSIGWDLLWSTYTYHIWSLFAPATKKERRR